ncbi:RNA-directed DNA polymerase, eukaryota, reverse transcriptase zinc-binding domain protein [Tanacetum coccineum]
MKKVAKTIGLMDAIAKINDPQCELLLLRSCTGISMLYFTMRTCPPRVFESAQRSFDVALRSSLERIITASGPGFGDWQWRLATLPFAFGGLGVYSAGDVLNYTFLASRLQSAGLQTKLLRDTGIVSPGPIFDDALSVFNTSMETDLLSNPSEIAAPKLMKKMTDIYFTRVTKNAESTFSLSPRQMALWASQREDHTSDWLRTIPISGLGQTTNGFFLGNIYGDHDVSCAGIIGIKHRHNVVRDTLVDICYRSGISAGKEVDIGLDGGRDKPLRPADMLLYSWDGGLDYFFLPFSFSSFGELEADAVTLLKRIRKFSMAQDIGARAAIHIFNRISFAIAKGRRILMFTNEDESLLDLILLVFDIGIQETHSLMIDPFKVKCLWGNFQFDYAVSPSSGRSGGLVSIWDKNTFTKLNVFPSENLLIVEGNWISTHTHCYMVNVYAPQDDRKKEILWHHILDFKEGNSGHYLIFGDFNVVRFASERIGTIFNPASANAFNQFIRDGHLWEIPHGGHLFTRINSRGDKLSKLDRFLITENSASYMHNYSAQVLDCHISDHRPIILSASSLDFGPTPFKFYNSWLLDKQLHTIVTEFWEQHVVEIGLIRLNRTSSQYREKEDLINKLKEFDEATIRGSGNIVVDSQRSTWLENLRNIELKENLDISQKAKVKWGIEADENSKFFHAIVNQKRRALSIHGIKHEGHWLSDPHTIKDTFHSFFESKFKNVDVDCVSDKSPGPDGFTFAFYKKNWDTIKDDVVDFVQDFFNTGILPHGCNTSFIARIPKIPNPMVVTDFRPISLIGAQYKIIAKVMANRLAQVMHFMGFSEKWIKWIKGCLYSARSSILINGSPTREFNINRGLRQGDPLSPFLFIIAMEGLHVAVEDALSAGLYRGLKVNTLNLSHFFFADDALFIGEWLRANIKSMVSILECFYRVSGLKINFHKSNLAGVGVPFEEVNHFALTTGCNAMQSPFLYLGLPVDCNMANTKSWGLIINKFSKRLSKWKSSLFSIGGRYTLISSVLGAIGTYYFSLFHMLVTVNNKLESLRSFFLGSDANVKKISWISWKLVLVSKDKGGLGIGSLYSLNHALIQKWRWHFFNNSQSL